MVDRFIPIHGSWKWGQLRLRLYSRRSKTRSADFKHNRLFMFVYVSNLCLLISVIVIFTQAVELPRFRLKVPCQFLEKSSRRDLFKCERHPACLVSGKLNFRLSIGARGWIKRIDDTPLKLLQEYLFSQGLNLDIRTDSPQESSKILWPSVIRVNLY